MLPIALRPYDKVGDESFLYSTWIKSYRDAGAVRAIPTPIYNIGQRHRINKIMKDRGTNILIACHPETWELIYGYAVLSSQNTIHYLYVKNAYRGMGVARALCTDIKWTDPVFYTHKPVDIALESKIKSDKTYETLIYNPYLLEKEI